MAHIAIDGTRSTSAVREPHNMEAILARIEQNMQTKVEAKGQLDEFKHTVTQIAKEFNEKVDQIQQDTDKKYEECQAAIRELKKEFEELKKGSSNQSREGGVKRPCNPTTRAGGRSASVDAGGVHRRDSARLAIQEKLEKRITISGYMGNSTKEFRESHAKQFLESIGTASNYGEIKVYAKGVHGSDTILEFPDCKKAEQFIKDEIESIKTFTVPHRQGTKKGFFQLYMDRGQWKVYHSTRLLAKKIGESE